MTYSTHRILPTGLIEVRLEKEDGTFYRYMIMPNESIDGEPQDVQKAVKADANYETYRTVENAEAYEARLIESDDL